MNQQYCIMLLTNTIIFLFTDLNLQEKMFTEEILCKYRNQLSSCVKNNGVTYLAVHNYSTVIFAMLIPLALLL